MLILTRRIGETISIGDQITVQISRVKGNQVQLAITALRAVPILRDDAEKVRDKAESSLRRKQDL